MEKSAASAASNRDNPNHVWRTGHSRKQSLLRPNHSDDGGVTGLTPLVA